MKALPTILGFSVVPILMNCSPVLAQSIDEESLHPAIPLLDEDGKHVLKSNKPYSPRTSCGTAGCHDYESITHSFHIEQGRDETDDDFGRRVGIDALIGPGYFGGYNCMGSNNPERLAKKHNASAADFADYGTPGLIMRCEGCHSGGGWMEKDRQGRRYDEVDPKSVKKYDGDYYNRGTDSDNQKTDSTIVARWNWKKSGVVENDCLMCHVDQQRLQIFDPKLKAEDGPNGYDLWRTLRRYKFIDNGFFRYNATAMMEYLNIRQPQGMNKDTNLVKVAKKNITVKEGRRGTYIDYDLDLDKKGLPKLTWNPEAFDERGKVSIPMVGFPTNDNCMQCHRTSNSRRGYYGFGEDAAAVYDEEGMLVDDYKDDVHYGKVFTEANGQSREIITCNACHARNYYREPWTNVDLDADHNFLKGNSDMNVADYRDYQPKAKSCIYCHDSGPNPVVPSGHKNMLDAHLALWKYGGDLRGYSKSELTGITQTHLDEISCQTCHITNKKNRGEPLQILYQYRRDEDGKLRMVPYNPRARYYWKDRNSGYILTKTERNSVFNEETNEDGDRIGVVRDPDTGEVVLEVSARISHGSLRYDDPDSYEGVVALKKIYDRLLAAKGIENPDAVMVWTEINHYLMSHNTRPSNEALDCESCHRRKSNGTISSLVAADSILGSGNVKEVTTLPDPRLVDEGIVVLDLPYMKINDEGVVTENVEDILYYTLVNPSMTRLNNETASFQHGKATKMKMDRALEMAGLKKGHQKLLAAELEGLDTFIFKPNYGVDPVRRVSIMIKSDPVLEMIMPYTSFEVSLPEKARNRVNTASAKSGETAGADDKKKSDSASGMLTAINILGGGFDLPATINTTAPKKEPTKTGSDRVAVTDSTAPDPKTAAQSVLGKGAKLASDLLSVEAINAEGDVIDHLLDIEMLVKLPYRGGSKRLANLQILYSENGLTWENLGSDPILAVSPANEDGAGYVVLATTELGYFAIADNKGSIIASCTLPESCGN